MIVNKGINQLYLDTDYTAMKKKWFIISAHIVAWFVLLLLPGFFRPNGPTTPGMHGGDLISDIFVSHRLANAVFLLILFYVNCYIAIPKFYLGRKYMSLVAYVLATIIAFVSMNYIIMNFGFAKKVPDSLFHYIGPSHNLLMFIIVYVVSFALSVYNQLLQTKEEKLNAEISFLKAQINPHFLFNTLNSIYSLALTKSDKTANAVVKLSSLMRYSISESDKQKVLLAKEIDYINNYIELQKLRITSNVKIDYNITGSAGLKEISPFLLIPFIENAFKYGVNSEENSDIKIAIDITEDMLHLHVVNNKVYVQNGEERNTGLGMRNTQQRLNLLYPGRHMLVVKNEDDHFDVTLQINW